jgi:chaperonin cofactor prefoldin
LKDRPFDALSKEELKKEHEKLVAILDKIESDAVTANQKVMELKDALYKKIKPEEPL